MKSTRRFHSGVCFFQDVILVKILVKMIEFFYQLV